MNQWWKQVVEFLVGVREMRRWKDQVYLFIFRFLMNWKERTCLCLCLCFADCCCMHTLGLLMNGARSVHPWCSVKLFLSEDSPSQVGFSSQDHLQAKASWISHPTGLSANDALPPGFEGGGQPTTQWQIKASDVPVDKWRCPPRFVVDVNWQVVAGEESQEVEVQNEREMRVLEAVYPRPSAIPQNPTFAVDQEDSNLVDIQIPLVPITPVEDEDAPDTPDAVGLQNFTMSSQHQAWTPEVPQFNIPWARIRPLQERPPGQVFPGVEPDVAAAASAALSAIAKSNETGNLIDSELLLQILSNPKLIEKLVADSAAGSHMQNAASTTAPFSAGPPSLPETLPDPSHLHVNRMGSGMVPSLAATSSGNSYNRNNGTGFPPNSSLPPPGFPASPAPLGGPQMKDVNYYKSLIQQHGGERHEPPPQHYGNPRDRLPGTTSQEFVNPKYSKPSKYMKPCAFFNSSTGCRNGANCAFQHDASSQQRGGSGSTPELQSAKRMKMDREISS